MTSPGVRDAERMRAHRAKRRRRRELQLPRLQYVESASGWTLTVPPNRSQVRLLVGITLAAAAAIVAVLVLESSWVGRGLYLAGIVALSFFGAPFLLGLRRTTYVDVGRDGQLTVHARRASHILHRGQAGASTIQVDFDATTALAEWTLTPGEESVLSFQGFGDRDIQVLKEFGAATRISFKTTRPEEAEKAAFVPIDERRSQIKGLCFVLIFVIGLFAVLKVLPDRLHVKGPELFGSESLKGSFHSTNKELGEWTLTPSGCVSGRERGFEGIAFLFPTGGPVEEIRVDTARQGDNVVEVRLADRKGTVNRFRERECQTIDGAIERTNLELNGRPMVRLKGNTHFSCPTQGLSGDADFDGCLPR